MNPIHKSLFTLVLLCIAVSVNAQNNRSKIPNSFALLQTETNDFFNRNPNTKGYKQWKRKEWFLAPRLYAEKNNDNLAQKTWAAYADYTKNTSSSRATHGSWSFIGPSSNNTGQGRVNAIEVLPSNNNVIYVGGSNGGIWKSTDGGINWTNKSPNIPLLAIADIEINPINENEIFVLTGDGDPAPNSTGNIAHSQEETRSIGIIKSTDGGNTWFPTAFSIDQSLDLAPTKLLIHPSNPNIQFIASNKGLYRTDNQWATHDTVILALTYDVEFHPGNVEVLYASGSNWIGKSTNGGLNWNAVTDADFSSIASDSRIELAVSPNATNVVYALAGNWTTFYGVFLSTSDGNNNTWTISNNSSTALGGFARYCTAIEVDPNDWTDVFAGFQWICKSGDSGANWSNITESVVHADIHDIKYVGNTLFVACDGGLYKSTNDGSAWTVLFNGLGITEIYRMSGTPQDEDLHLIGAQDNGTMEKTSSSTTFTNPGGGDGMTNHINPTNSLIKYLSSQNGAISRTTDGTNYSGITIPGGNGAWVTPFIFDPTVNARMFVGKSNVHRSEDGATSWNTLVNPFGGLVNCMALSHTNQNKLYLSSGSQIAWTNQALSTTSNITWTNISAGFPNLFITDIAVNPDDDTEIFITMSGYDDGERVYKSNNSGGTWENITGTLPAVPVNTIVYHDNGQNNDALYIGTDIGVFYRNNNIGDWIFFSNLMPVAIVTDLYINTGFNTLSAATYGRGLWKSPLYDGCVNDINFGYFGGGVRYYSVNNTIISDVDLPKDLGHSVHLKGGNSVTLNPGFTAGGEINFDAKIGPCPSPISNLSNQVSPQSNFVMSDEFYRRLMRL